LPRKENLGATRKRKSGGRGISVRSLNRLLSVGGYSYQGAYASVRLVSQGGEEKGVLQKEAAGD